ncbi:MAG: CorA family divalent cation transporter, partial [Enterobacteriaceae bacterium]
DKQHSIREFADRLARAVDDLDACIARTAILADEIENQMSYALNRRSYIMSLMAMLFLPLTFLTGLLGVNLGGIPGNQSPYGFIVFSVLLISLLGGVAWWLHRSKWI